MSWGSPVKKERNKYQKKIEAIDKSLSNINSALDEIPGMRSKVIGTFRGEYTNDGSQGRFVYDFEGKVAYVEWEIEILYSSLLASRDQLQTTRATLENHLATLNSYCRQEDETHKSVQLADIKW